MMRRKGFFLMLLLVMGSLVLASTAMSGMKKSAMSDKEMVEHGRYLVQVAGCNDCHTAGYLLNDGKIPEAQWLEGDSFGWRGPWGTTYAANLRTFINGMSEEQWITVAKALKRRPPMPWFDVNIMKDSDLKAIYQYVKSVGPAGGPAPAYVPPGVEPKMPYALFPSPPKP
jgi:mono/diheme cytochrome c family protein